MHIPSALAPLFLATTLLAQTRDELFTVSPADGMLRVVDPLTAATIRSTQIVTTTSAQASACNGLALHPITRQLFGIVRTGGSQRHLATIDPATAIATVVGTLADNFAGIAFRLDGTLFGVTGDGANVPESLFTINLSNATSTLVAPLGNGNDGETLAYNPIDGFLYHCSGLGVPNVNEVFERVDPATGVATPIALTGFDHDEMLGLTHWTGGNLLGVDLLFDLVVIGTNGRVTRLGRLDHDVKGLVFLPTSDSLAYFRPYGEGCASSTNQIPLLVHRGVPALGQAVSFEIRLAPPNAFGLLLMGFGTATVPFPSPTCQVQINPLASGAVSFTANAAGSFTLAATIPATLPAGDFFFQAGLLDGANFVVTNPLQVHVR